MRWYLQSSRTNITDKQFTKSLSTAGTLVSLTLGRAPGHGKEEGYYGWSLLLERQMKGLQSFTVKECTSKECSRQIQFCQL